MYNLNNSTLPLDESHSVILELVQISTLDRRLALIITDTGSLAEIQDAVILKLGMGWAIGLPTVTCD